MPSQRGLIDLDVSRPGFGESARFLTQSSREVEREGLLLAVMLVERQGRERERAREDRLHGSARVRLGELPLVDQDRLVPGDGTPGYEDPVDDGNRIKGLQCRSE